MLPPCVESTCEGGAGGDLAGRRAHQSVLLKLSVYGHLRAQLEESVARYLSQLDTPTGKSRWRRWPRG
jgi:hypothetical protein